MRELKNHEKKLLRKVDLLHWKSTDNIHETQVMRRYHITKRDDYVKYNKIIGMIHKVSERLSILPLDDTFRREISDQMINKMTEMGFLGTKKGLPGCKNINVASVCRRRLAVVMVRLKMSETVKQAVKLIEQGHVRVGPHCVTDPAFLITRKMEDHVTWMDQSKIRKKVLMYNDKLDDYDLL
ncbi:small nucleolar ribonucleo protein U3 component [Rozella allomycis CSF55]|uniref:U3 small nucleolar ribonucleoprotein protein IMP3 n=1 Tax=Rozella allomycis (strain CSF55) TaxID=988480 RepID=A0A075B240_ROZAC|nr:Ribosomal protein S4/S9 domain-containing protein [Rozella allomycis CSF55]RKP17213.1 small nucleolar ribonucleo protein U3 component [Rozella allomycis CSF55]|eukprot:EPZ36620.1 Ribosomal protein S4/S9 domain-containing protein [Rozella allomycis CSF55]